MQKIYNNTFLTNRWVLSILAGVCVFLAFETFNWVPILLMFPLAFNASIRSARSTWEAFGLGFLTSLIIMLGGFYWVTYVIHEFGGIPWSISGLLFLGFCGFGALNFPVFAALAYFFNQRSHSAHASRSQLLLWYSIGTPALFTLIEWAIPKLFPWYIGHALYRQLWAIQICEFTGATLLTFIIYSLGSTLDYLLQNSPAHGKPMKRALFIPGVLIALQLFIGFWCLKHRSFALSAPLKVALIQANIGNLDKVQAKQGSLSRVDTVLSTYSELSRQALIQKPDLMVWPETAIPLRMDIPSPRQFEIHNLVKEFNIPLISGGYGSHSANPNREHNSAFLLDPSEGSLRTEVYHKNILLAFGEYLPLGEAFPVLYRMFPQVSDFARGHEQKAFTLSNGIRLGISICYEAIVPSFMRKVAQQKVQALVNLTNDSWFGPTSEPYLHGALTVFRSVEHRLPQVRVTNTGASFTVDHLGQMSNRSEIYRPEALIQTISPRAEQILTPYGEWGDWIIAVLGILLGFLIFKTWRNRASVSV